MRLRPKSRLRLVVMCLVIVYLTNAVSNGAPSGGAWFDSEVELMTERIRWLPCSPPMGDGQKDPWSAMHNYTVEKSQLPLFALNPAAIVTRYDYWLRDVVTAAIFACVNGLGLELWQRFILFWRSPRFLYLSKICTPCGCSRKELMKCQY